jgi:hypothetical protein
MLCVMSMDDFISTTTRILMTADFNVFLLERIGHRRVVPGGSSEARYQSLQFLTRSLYHFKLII